MSDNQEKKYIIAAAHKNGQPYVFSINQRWIVKKANDHLWMKFTKSIADYHRKSLEQELRNAVRIEMSVMVEEYEHKEESF